MSSRIKNLTVVITAALFVFGFFAAGLILPDKELSESERRYLADFPEINGDSIVNGKFMTEFDEYTLDQFPLRDRFRSIKAIAAGYLFGQRDNNGIYVQNGHLAKLEYPLDIKSVSRAAARFGYVYDEYLKDSGSSVYLSVVPDKSYFLAKENGYPSIDYDLLVNRFREEADFGKYIDIMPLLEIDDYYATDTPWRQEQIFDVAEKIAAEMGVSLDDEYEKVKAADDFYGVYYGQAALPFEPEELYYVTSETLSHCKVYDYETDSYISVYDEEKLGERDPYEFFLSGAKSLLTIENEAATTEKELIIFRDSFGSSIAPYFAEGYSKVTLVDIRYISPQIIGKYLDFEGKDVLFLYSTSVLNNSTTIK